MNAHARDVLLAVTAVAVVFVTVTGGGVLEAGGVRVSDEHR